MGVFPMVGAEPSILDDTGIAHVVAQGHHILSRRTVPGLRVELEETPAPYRENSR